MAVACTEIEIAGKSSAEYSPLVVALRGNNLALSNVLQSSIISKSEARQLRIASGQPSRSSEAGAAR